MSGSGMLQGSNASSKISACWFGLSSILSSSSSARDTDSDNNVRKDSQYETAEDRDEISSISVGYPSSKEDETETLQQQEQHVTHFFSKNKKNANAVKNTQTVQGEGPSSDRSARFRRRSQLKKAGEEEKEKAAAESQPHPAITQGCGKEEKTSNNKGHPHQPQRLCSFADAPPYLKFNPDIMGGYRSNISPWDCVRSIFWWTNETLNIWTHLLGWIFFLGLSVYDSLGLLNMATIDPWDRVIVAFLLISFQACMLLSALYHVFCCCSESHYRRWLSADLLGVSLSLLGVYVSGIYYAFSCISFWLHFYMITVAAIFALAMVLQIIPIVNRPTTKEAFRGRLIVFGGWGAYGILPMFHWAVLHGGMSSPIVALLLPRIFWMYGISVAAFFFFVLRVPEKFWPGLVDYIGSSHQIWHVLIVAALYHWHNTGVVYLEFRANNSCQAEYEFLFQPDSTPDDVAQADTDTVVET